MKVIIGHTWYLISGEIWLLIVFYFILFYFWGWISGRYLLPALNGQTFLLLPVYLRINGSDTFDWRLIITCIYNGCGEGFYGYRGRFRIFSRIELTLYGITTHNRLSRSLDHKWLFCRILGVFEWQNRHCWLILSFPTYLLSFKCVP